MPSGPPIVLPPDCIQSNQLKSNAIGCEPGDEQPNKKMMLGEKIPSLAEPAAAATTTAAFTSGDATTAEIILPELSLEATIRTYLEKVATPEHSGTALLKSLEELDARVTNRIPVSHNDTEAAAMVMVMATATAATTTTSKASDSTHNDSIVERNDKKRIDNTEVWIPPLRPLAEDDTKDSHTNTTDVDTVNAPNTDAKMRAERKGFHRAIRIKYPFLKTVSADNTAGKSTTSTGTSTLQPPNDNTKNNSDEHWIKITVENCFDELIEYLNTPRDDLRQLLFFRNRGFEGASPRLKSNSSIRTATIISSATLRLRPGVCKDDRRKVHHILALKNKHFESSIRHQGSKKKNSSKSIPTEKEGKSENGTTAAADAAETTATATTDLVVTWKKQALMKGAKKNNKRKRFENGKGDSSNYKTDTNLLCVLKKTQKEHLTTMQTLSRTLKCRQSDIGFAGIKGNKIYHDALLIQ